MLKFHLDIVDEKSGYHVHINSQTVAYFDEYAVISYNITDAGLYYLHVRMTYNHSKTLDILGSPFSPTYYPNKPYGLTTKCTGIGLRHGTKGTSIPFEVLLKDRYGNQLTASGHRLYVRLLGDDDFEQRYSMIPRCVDIHNGKFMCHYTAKYSGLHNVVVKILNTSISEVTTNGGTGLVAQYFTNDIPALSDPLFVENVDNIDYVWPTGALLIQSDLIPPFQDLSFMGQSVLYSGYIVSPYDDSFFISCATQNINATIFIDDVLVFDTAAGISSSVLFQNQSAYSISVSLTTYRSNSTVASAAATLQWRRPSMSFPIVIPKFYLYNNVDEVAYSPFQVKVV